MRPYLSNFGDFEYFTTLKHQTKFLGTLKDHFNCTLAQSKINLNGRLRMDGRTTLTKAMKLASNIPVVGAIYNLTARKSAGSSLDSWNETAMKSKLRAISRV